MAESEAPQMPEEFAARMNGGFAGIVSWRQLDDLWSRVLAQPEGWYASLAGADAPATPLTAEALRGFVAELDALLRREHAYDYCGIVYADDPMRPGFIKIYDPHDLGSSCGASGTTILPRWVLSRVVPTRIGNGRPLTGSRRRWWQALFR